MHLTENMIWFAALAQEAKRDLVFAWNIARGSFGGPREQDEVPVALFMEAVEHLLVAGCKVGFGDPDSIGWRELPNANKDNYENARSIAELWDTNRQDYQFLVFAIRS